MGKDEVHVEKGNLVDEMANCVDSGASLTERTDVSVDWGTNLTLATVATVSCSDLKKISQPVESNGHDDVPPVAKVDGKVREPAVPVVSTQAEKKKVAKKKKKKTQSGTSASKSGKKEKVKRRIRTAATLDTHKSQKSGSRRSRSNERGTTVPKIKKGGVFDRLTSAPAKETKPKKYGTMPVKGWNSTVDIEKKKATPSSIMEWMSSSKKKSKKDTSKSSKKKATRPTTKSAKSKSKKSSTSKSKKKNETEAAATKASAEKSENNSNGSTTVNGGVQNEVSETVRSNVTEVWYTHEGTADDYLYTGRREEQNGDGQTDEEALMATAAAAAEAMKASLESASNDTAPSVDEQDDDDDDSDDVVVEEKPRRIREKSADSHKSHKKKNDVFSRLTAGLGNSSGAKSKPSSTDEMVVDRLNLATITIMMYANGEQLAPGVPILLKRKALTTWKRLLAFLSKRMKLPTGPVKKLYHVRPGRKRNRHVLVRKLADLCDTAVYLCCGAEKINDKAYPNDLRDVVDSKAKKKARAKSPQRSKPKSNSPPKASPQPVVPAMKGALPEASANDSVIVNGGDGDEEGLTFRVVLQTPSMARDQPNWDEVYDPSKDPTVVVYDGNSDIDDEERFFEE